MINSGKCPKCAKTVSVVRIEDVSVNVGFQPSWNGISFCCQSCGSVLSVGIDPIALKADLVREIVAALQR